MSSRSRGTFLPSSLSHPLRSPTRSSRRFATVVQPHLSPSSPYSYIPYFPNTPSPIATSSSWTLDHPLWTVPPAPTPVPTDYPPNSISALVFASDDDLISALIPSSPFSSSSTVPTTSESEMKWSNSIDPGLAFLALRGRPTFGIFLASLHPHLTTVYPSLVPSGTHQLLVSDLLLRHPDPTILRDLLELDQLNPIPKRLRTSLFASIYTLLLPSMDQIAPLSFQTNLRMVRYLSKVKKNKDDGLLLQAFEQLVQNTPNTPTAIWTLLALVLDQTPKNPGLAISMFRSLVVSSKIPKDLLGKSNPKYPAYREIMIYSAILRFALLHKLHERAWNTTDLLMTIMRKHGAIQSAWEAVLESVRTAVAGKVMVEVRWGAGIIDQLCGLSDQHLRGGDLDTGYGTWRFIPGSTIDAVLRTTIPSERADWLYSLDPGVYEPPSAEMLLDIAKKIPHHRSWVRIVADFRRLPIEETLVAQGPFLRILGSSGQIQSLKGLYGSWNPRLEVEDMLGIVASSFALKDRDFGKEVLLDWIGTDQGNKLDERERIKVVEWLLIFGQRGEARTQLARIDLGAEGAESVVEAVLRNRHIPSDAKALFEEMGYVSPSSSTGISVKVI